jgi:hypothetical protein
MTPGIGHAGSQAERTSRRLAEQTQSEHGDRDQTICIRSILQHVHGPEWRRSRCPEHFQAGACSDCGEETLRLIRDAKARPRPDDSTCQEEPTSYGRLYVMKWRHPIDGLFRNLDDGCRVG